MPTNNTLQIDLFFEKINSKVQAVEQALPHVVANEALNATLSNFKTESFFGEPWKKRKDKKNKRQLLVKTGAMRRSVTILSMSPGRVVLGSRGIPYAGIHNNGGTIFKAARSETFVRNRHTRGPKAKMFGGMGAFKKGTKAGQGLSFREHSINIPQRQFIGASPVLKERVRKAAQEYINHTLNT